MADEITTPTPATIIPIDTPFYQVNGGQTYKLNPETTAKQVKTSDGLNVEVTLAIIQRALAGNTTARFAETIAERDALTNLIPGDVVIVTDASDDETVQSGGARYCYLPDGAGFKKISEDESMDIVCDWAHVENKPESTVAQIDLAVAKQHQHDNTETLTHLSDDGAENLLFFGKRVCPDKVWVARVASLADIPTNLADNGLVILTGGATE